MICKNIEGFQMALDPSDGGISNVLNRHGSREDAFMWLLRREAVGCLGLDIGANIGYTTLSLCRNMDRVIALEPDPRSRKLLEENVKLNKYENKCDIGSEIVSDKVSTDTIYLNKKPNLSSIVSRSGTPRRVESTTIDEICNIEKICPSFIKMDIEGAEVQVLKGGREALFNTDECKILMEVHPTLYNGNEFMDVLSEYVDAGFNIKYVIPARAHRKFMSNCGYEPMIFFNRVDRGVYSDIRGEDAIRWASRVDGKTKRIRAIMLGKR